MRFAEINKLAQSIPSQKVAKRPYQGGFRERKYLLAPRWRVQCKAPRVPCSELHKRGATLQCARLPRDKSGSYFAHIPKDHPARATEMEAFRLPEDREEAEQEALCFHPKEWGMMPSAS